MSFADGNRNTTNASTHSYIIHAIKNLSIILQMTETRTLILFIFPFPGNLLASSPKYLKPGALSAYIGSVALIKDALIFRPFAPLVMVPVQLKIVATHLNTTADVLPT